MKIIVTTKEKQWYEITEGAMGEEYIQTTLDEKNRLDIKWEGFGGCFNELSMEALNRIDEPSKDGIYDQLFSQEADGLRLNFCRLPIGASDYAVSWYSYDEKDDDYEMNHFSIERDQKLLIPYIKQALKRNCNIKFFASPWSPPTWMKTRKVCNYGTLIQTKENLTAYALYLCRYIEEYAKEGITISQIHVQNEPVSDQKFPSCIWKGEEFATFIGKYLGPMMKERGLTTKIWLGTLNGPETDKRAPYTRYNDYANLVLHDVDAYRYIEGISYQWAGKYAVQITGKSFPEKKIIQSENECGDGNNTWQYANYIFEMFQHYISNGVCAYVYWNMVLEDGGRSTWGWTQNSMLTIQSETGRVNYEYEFYVMKHFSRYVELGAEIIELTGHLAGNAVCFRNPDHTSVLVVQNPFNKPISFIWHKKQVVLLPESINTILD